MSLPVTIPPGAAWSPPVLRATEVAKVWAGRQALAPVTLTISPHEIVAVCGRPGSGRTTLLELLAGSCLPDAGEIERSGDWALDGGWSSWRHTTLVPAGGLLTPELSVGENVAEVLRALGVDRMRRTPFVLHVLDRLDLVHVVSRLAGDLAPGERQRLAVARAVVGGVAGAAPTVLLADEPTSQQDAAGAALVLDALQTIVAAGTAVVVATDDPTLIAHARVVTLDS